MLAACPPMSPVTRERHEWEGDKNKLGGKDWVEDDRCGCVISLQTGDADGDETRSVVAWGPNAQLSFRRPRWCCAGACVPPTWHRRSTREAPAGRQSRPPVRGPYLFKDRARERERDHPTFLLLLSQRQLAAPCMYA